MSIMVKGASLHYTSEDILNRCAGMRDTSGRKFSVITLKASPFKPVTSGTKRKGAYEDTMIVRSGTGGIKIYTPPENEYGKKRTTGTLHFLRDGFTGEYVAKIADTPQNRKMLACTYYDMLDVYTDPQIEAEIKKMADAIDEENKKIPWQWERTVKEVNPKTGQTNFIVINVNGSVYDFNKERRENQFKNASNQTTITPVASKALENQKSEVYLSEIEKLKAQIEELKAGVAPKEEESKPNIIEEINESRSPDVLTIKDCKNLSIAKLKKVLIGLGDGSKLNAQRVFKLTKKEILREIAEITGEIYEEEEECQPQAAT